MRNLVARRGVFTAILMLHLTAGCSKPPRLGEPLDDLTREQRDRFERGRRIFERVFIPETGLGPLFNAASCVECHEDPVPGGAGDVAEVHASVLLPSGFCDPLVESGGPVFQLHTTPALREALGLDKEPVPPQAAVATRTAPDVFGFGLLDAVPDSTLLALADPGDADGDGISGRVNRFFDGRIGRFGRKALLPTLAEFNEGAFQIEQGVTVPAIPDEGTVGGLPIPEGVDPLPEPELDAESVALVDDFVRFLAPPRPQKLSGEARRGEKIFRRIGCAACHVPKLRTGPHEVSPLAFRDIWAYTDLLLHDMGAELADICLAEALPSEFRTEPLMGLRHSESFMHDGRAKSVEEAILLHAGEAAAARDTFGSLSPADREALLEFLGGL